MPQRPLRSSGLVNYLISAAKVSIVCSLNRMMRSSVHGDGCDVNFIAGVECDMCSVFRVVFPCTDRIPVL
jgi:hypothetical protein